MELMKIDEYLDRAKENLKIARMISGYSSASSIVDELKNRGVKVSQSAVSRYEDKSNNTAPSIEYILGLHMLTGIAVEVLVGIREWGDNGFSGEDPESNEVYRMISNLSPRVKDIAEIQIAVLYNYDKAEGIGEIKKNLGIDD